ncbi:hypothetical protein [Azospirillum soli]|uniref:hypothetical protein n=1 Tax=Azospirillum soli TaxID=1304799 RepID=UPI001AE17EA8|nr:hypothetical protein [Azospirillum soli]MBP2315991.1 hypothetical protein [Azospirillum soli]
MSTTTVKDIAEAASLPAASSPRSWSATLAAAVETPTAGVVTENGYELRPAPWVPPRVVSEELRREAVHALGVLRVHSGPVDVDLAQRWVAHFAARLNGSNLPPATKLTAAVSDIVRERYPAVLFDDHDLLLRVVRRFEWWPGWAELAPVLDAERARLRLEWERLSVIAKGGKVKEPARPDREEDRPAGPRTLSAATKELLRRAYADLDSASDEMRRGRR